jgi:hypothetical protein
LDQHVLHLGAAIAIVGGLISLCDFLEKVGPFTTIAMLASAFGLAVAFVLYKTGYLSANFGRNACLALLLMLGGSASVKAAQSFIPGASENGVIAQVVPGASALQNTMLSSLGRIEEQTKRVSDILEDNARREQQARDAESKQRSDKIKELRALIAEGGYSLDEAGYLAAALDGQYLEDFAQVGITISEAGLRNFLANVDDNKKLSALGKFLDSRRDTIAVRKVIADYIDDGKKMPIAFQNKGARSAVCDASAYALPIAIEQFTAACKLDGRAFAQAYAEYFNETYGRLMHATHVRADSISPLEYLKKSLSELPIQKVDAPLVLSKLPGCAYYQGVLSFSLDDNPYSRGDSGWQNDEPGTSLFGIVDKAAVEGGIKNWCQVDSYSSPNRCRGNVIVTRDCKDTPSNTILRVFSIDKPGSKTFNQQEASR